MTILRRAGALAILFTALVTGLSACNVDFTTLPFQRDVESVDVVTSNHQNAYVIDDFDLSSILLEVEEEGGDVRTVPIKEDYLDDASLEALEEPGSHELQGEYRDQTFSFEIRLVETSRDLLMHTVYSLGVEDADLEEDYETWLESIEGVSVSDASIDEDGKLILTLSDETTIDAGLVKGEDGVDGRGIESIHRENGDELIFTYDDGSEESLSIEFDPHTVKFKTDDDTLVDVQYVLEGGTFTHPEAPKREGYAFDEWSESESTEVNEDMTVTAEYTRQSYELTLETDSDEGTTTDTYEYGETIDYPALNESGREFIGWYHDESFSTFFAEETMPAKDTTLYARWIDETGGTEDSSDMIDSVRGAMVRVINLQDGDSAGSGSGVIYKENGDDSYYLFTNQHVIEDQDNLEILYDYNNNQYKASESNVELIGSYAEADIAVIRFTPSFPVETVDFADSYQIGAGQTVYAYGSPGDSETQSILDHTVTKGIVSNTHRMLSVDTGQAVFLQHDASISPGNSGGALLDAEGNIVGMNTSKINADDVEGIAFALPSNTIRRMVDELEADGTIERAEFGASIGSVDACGYDYGACIESVDSGETADELGLEADDQIIGFKRSSMDDFFTIYNEDYLYQAVMDTETGTSITVEYVRDGDIEESSGTMQ